MGGEMTPSGTFDVTKLECWEGADPATAVLSSIIDVGEDFFLRAYFEGTGDGWHNMTEGGFHYVCKFYAEGMGFGIPNVDLGQMEGDMDPLDAPDYAIDMPVNHIDTEGIYRCGVTVTFQLPGGVGHWYGVLGYNEDCVIQVNPEEQP